MTESLGRAVLVLEADGGHFKKSLASAKSETAGFVSHAASGLKSIAKVAAFTAGATGLGALAVTLKAGLSEWVDSEKVAAQTGAVIKSTGQAANVTAKQVDALATSIMNKSGIDDEAIKTGENMLLTFTSVRNEVGQGNDIFNQATQAVTDMDVAMTHGNSTQESLSKTAILVGKALNDPIKGATALRRVGVQLTEAQTQQIAAFVKSGDTMKAQKIILAELTKEFGGSAKAIGDTLPGKINILRENFKNLAGSLVGTLAPALSGVVEKMTGFFQKLNAAQGFRAKLQVIWEGAENVAKGAFDLIRQAVTKIDWAGLWRGISLKAQSLVDSFNTELKNANWAAISKTITDVLVKSVSFAAEMGRKFTEELAKATASIDWVQVLKGLVLGIKNDRSIPEAVKDIWLKAWNLNPVTLPSQIGAKGVQALVSSFNKGFGPQAQLDFARQLSDAIDRQVIQAVIDSQVVAEQEGKKIGSSIASGAAAQLYADWQGVARGIIALVQTSLKFAQDHAGSTLEQFAGRMLGVPIVTGTVKGFTDAGKVLGPTLAKLLNSVVSQASKGVSSSASAITKGLSPVGKLIVEAAKKWGVDARAAMAVAMTEGGLKFGAVGDSGHSFGPFQFNNAGGVASGMSASAASAWANSAKGISDAIRMMADAGARGKTGLDAITAMVKNFERPLDPSGEIRKAIDYYKKLPAEVGNAAVSVATQTGAKVGSTLKGVATLITTLGKQIGLDHARAIVTSVVQGMNQGQPTLLQQIRTQTAERVAAMKQAVLDRRADFISAFQTLATNALSAFDAKMQTWVPPTQRLLNTMNFADQLKGINDSLAQAMAEVSGGGATAAAEAGAKIGTSITDAINGSMAKIGGAKTFAALNQAALDAQTAVTQAIDTAAAASLTQAQTAVTNAQAALQAAQATGDPEQIAAAQQALDTAVANQTALNAAVVAAKEQALQPLVDAEQRTHDAIAAKQREGLAKQLTELETELAKHPEKWNTMAGKVQTLLAGYNVKLVSAGKAWASKFGDGIIAGIPDAVRAAHQLADAVAAVLPTTNSPLRPAREGPLAFHPYDMGRLWVQNMAAGLRAGRIGDLVGGVGMGAPSFAAAAGGGGQPSGDLILKVNGAELGRVALSELLRARGRNVTLGLG